MAATKKKRTSKMHALIERNRQAVISNTINSFTESIPDFTSQMKKEMKLRMIFSYIKFQCLMNCVTQGHSTLGKIRKHESYLFAPVDNDVKMDPILEHVRKCKRKCPEKKQLKTSLKNQMQKQCKTKTTGDKPVQQRGRPHIVFLKKADDSVNAPSKVIQASGNRVTDSEVFDDESAVNVNGICEPESSSSYSLLSNGISSVQKEGISTSAISKELSPLSDFNTSRYINDLARHSLLTSFHDIHENPSKVQCQQDNTFDVASDLQLPEDVSLTRNKFSISKAVVKSNAPENDLGKFLSSIKDQPQEVPVAFGYNSKSIQNVGSENRTATNTTVANHTVQETPGLRRCNTVIRGTSLREMNKENVSVLNRKTNDSKRVCTTLSDFNIPCDVNDLAELGLFYEKLSNVQCQQDNTFDVASGLHLPGDVSLTRNKFSISKAVVKSDASENGLGKFVSSIKDQPQEVPVAFGYNSKFAQDVGSVNTVIANHTVQETPRLRRCNTVVRGTSLWEVNKENAHALNRKTEDSKRVCTTLNARRIFSNNVEISQRGCSNLRKKLF